MHLIHMKYLVIIIFSLLLHAQIPSFVPRTQGRFMNITKPAAVYTNGNNYIYNGLLTGNKKYINKKILSLFKKYGLLHLLTPSGLHLGSILFFVQFSQVLEILLLFWIFYTISKYSAYSSLERIIMYRGIHHGFKKFKIPITTFSKFMITIILSIVIGHFDKNPLSLFYSFIFWGTVLIFKDQKLKCILFLNLSLHLTASLQGEASNFLSIIINPIFTFIFSSYYPVLFLSSFTPNFEMLHTFNNFFLNSSIDILILIDQFSIFPNLYLSPITVLLFIISYYTKFIKVGVFLTLISSFQLNLNKEKQKESNIINDKLSRCTTVNMQFICKKKAYHKW